MFLALISIVLARIISAIGQEKYFTFKAHVYYKNKLIKCAVIEVYNAGDLVYETLSKGGGRFQFDLLAEKECMVEVSTPTKRLKTIWINTKKTKVR